jgi:ribonucleoside-triphosphate reductase
MRNLEEIEKDLGEAREALSNVKGTEAEVYSRIVGYYRSVRNWNKGKREEYGERRLYDVKTSGARLETCIPRAVNKPVENTASGVVIEAFKPLGTDEARLLLFVRSGCPACPGAKAAAGKLGIPVDTIDASGEDGLAEAGRWNVMSTPTAILVNERGEELARAHSGAEIAALSRFARDGGIVEYKNAASM